MPPSTFVGREARLIAKYSGASLVGFTVDFTVLHVILWTGTMPAWARIVSLIAAMHATFAINGLHVFCTLNVRHWRAQWASYMATNSVGNICNYWIFVALVSTHWTMASSPAFAMVAGSLVAWGINFLATRFLVFQVRPLAPVLSSLQSVPSPASPE